MSSNSNSPGNYNILIVEDLTETVDQLIKILADSGQQAKTADSSQKIILTKKNHPELIIINSKFWERDFFTELQKKAEKFSVPVILYENSQIFQKRVQEISFEKGIADYISYPFVAKEIMARIKTQIELRRLKIKNKEINPEEDSKPGWGKKSEEFYQSILDGVQDGIWAADEDDKIYYINNKIGSIFGFSFELIEGKNFLTDFPEDTVGELKKYYLKAKNEKISVRYEIKIKTPSGRLAWQNGWLIPQFSNGLYKGIVCTIHDITKQKKAEKLSENSEGKYRNLYENSPYGIIVCKMIRNEQSEFIDFIHLEANRATPENTGFNLEEMIGLKASEMVDKKTCAELVERYGKVVSTGESFKYEQYFEIYQKHLSVTVFALTEDYFIINFVDITERKNFELKLKKSEEKYRLIDESSPDYIFSFDLNNRLTHANPSFIKFLDFPKEKILGKSLAELGFPSETCRLWDASFQSVCEKNSTFDAQTVFSLKGERPRHYLIVLNPNHDEKGNIIGVSGLARDITEEKTAESELKKIEWLLKPKRKKIEIRDSNYGDLTELNTERTILDSVGKDVLMQIVSDYLSLLDTAAAVYEKNGDYALGVFSSEWCRLLDNSSRSLCNGCQTNKEALESGDWLCHNSCWNDTSLRSIQTNLPMDVECNGGIHIYAIPIRANGEVVGAINFGYGNPPQEEEQLVEISEKYKVPVEDLRIASYQYEIRPPFIIDIAKEKLEISARLIGEIVERETAKQTMRINEKKFRTLFENINVGVALHEIITDKNGEPEDFIFLDVNPLFEKITGLKKEDIIGRRGSEVVPQIDNQWVKSQGSVALTGEAISYVDYFDYLGKYLEVNVFSPAAKQFAVAMVDITERIRAQEDIKRSKELAELYLEMAGGIFLSLSHEGEIILINNKGLEILGFTNKEDLIGKKWIETCIPEEIKNEIRDVFDQIFSGDMGDFEYFENEILTKNGERRVISWYNSFIRDKDGEIQHLLSSGIDVTDIRKADKELKESEERFYLAMNAARDGIYDWNLISDKIYFSPGWKRMIGYDYDEIPNDFLSWKNNTDPQGVEDTMNLIEEVVARKRERFEVEFQMKHKQGYWIDILSRAEGVVDKNGKVVRLVGTHTDISEWKRMEEVLRLGELKYRELAQYLDVIIEKSPLAMWISDEDGVMIRSNQAFRSLLNLSDEALIGKYNVLKDTHLTEQGVGSSVEDVFRNKQSVRSVFLWRGGKSGNSRKKRKDLWIDASFFPITDEKGELRNVVCQYVDITELKNIEKALLANQESYKKAQKMGHVGNWEYFPKEKRLWASDEALKIFGRENYHDRLTLDIISKSIVSKSRLKDALKELILENGKYEFVFDIITYDKKERKTVHSITEAERDRNNKLVKISGIINDITERTKSEEERTKLATLISQSTDDIMITDTEGNIEYVNPAFEKLSGYSFEQVKGHSPRILKSGKHNKEFYREMWKTITSGEVWSGTIINSAKDGTLFEENSILFPIFAADNKTITNYGAIKRDTSESRKMEDQLRQSQKMKAIGTLAGGIAHDFNNILSSILGYTQLSLERIPPENKAYSYMEEVVTASVRASELVKQILSFSRDEAREVRPILVQSFIKEALKLLRSSIPKNYEIVSRIDPDCETVLADPTQIHQVVMNLVTNAYHSMRDLNTGKIEVSVQRREIYGDQHSEINDLPNGSYIYLSVKDQGHGIPSEQIEEIFEPYFTTKRKGEGTGLGLSIVYSIVKSYGGDISVESVVGEGTTFNIWLPVYRQGDEQTEDAAEYAGLDFGAEHIMVIDDEKSITELNTLMLESIGYRVSSFTDSVAALNFFKESPEDFDLIITDMTMPGIMGNELAKEVFKIRPEIPIIICTGYSDTVNEEDTKKLGIKDFIIKPFTMQELSRTVRTVLDSRQGDNLNPEETSGAHI